MREKVKIPEIILEVESGGSFARAEKVVKKVLEVAGVKPAQDGGALLMHPIENGSRTMRISISELESEVEVDD